MAFGAKELIDGVRSARANFLKHIEGVSADQTTWKPYDPCKTINETLDHLRWSDRAALDLLQTGAQPDYTTAPGLPPAESFDRLRAELIVSHAALLAYLEETYGDKPLDTSVNFWGHPTALGTMLAAIQNEEGYHTGQVSYIRQATDPSWDYYAAIYG